MENKKGKFSLSRTVHNPWNIENRQNAFEELHSLKYVPKYASGRAHEEKQTEKTGGDSQWQPKVLLVSIPAKGQSGNFPVHS